MILQKKKPQKDLITVRCQKCLNYGHYNFQCTNKRKFLKRDSRTVILNKNLSKKTENKPEPPTKKMKKQDLESATGELAVSSSSSDSEDSSSSSSSSSSSKSSFSSSSSSSSSNSDSSDSD